MNPEQELRDRIPSHLMGAIDRYLQHGITPGGFLTAVITNDLAGAFNRADAISRHYLFDIVKYFWNYAPSSCWGSSEAMNEWSYWVTAEMIKQ